MQTFYSILYANTRLSIQERLSIGLVLWNEERVFFHYSSSKLEILNAMLESEAAFKMLKASVLNFNNWIQVEQKENLYPHNVSINEMNYLATYCNNLISFSKPEVIKVEVTESSFNSLFNLFIWTDSSTDNASRSQNAETFEMFVRNQLFPRLKNRMNWDIELTPDKLPNLVFNTSVSFIGVNGVVVAGQSINFDKRSYNLKHDLGSFFNLIKAIQHNREAGKYYIIGDEPQQKDLRYTIWDNVRKLSYIEYVPKDETEKIVIYAEENDVKPFLVEQD